jgi:HK97 family phage portal protein
MFEKIFAPTEKRELTTAESNAEVLRSIALSETMITAETAMQIPMVARCVNMIAGAVAMLPIRMYRRIDGKVEEITEDRRLELLNTDTGDTMNADYMRYAWVRDLILCGNAYAFIERKGGKPENIYYVAAKDVGGYRNEMDPIHKEFTYNVGGKNIKPWEMLKILRDTDGYGTGIGIVEENRDILSTALNLIT